MIYLDHAATTPLREEVFEAMRPFLLEDYGNASSLYTLGQKSRIAVEGARWSLASLLGILPSEVFFTSGGTESDNWALRKVMEDAVLEGSDSPVKGRRHLIVSSMEHPAVLKTAKMLEKQGFSVTYLPVDREGYVSVEELEKALTKDTALVSIMAANNELGTIQPLKELAAVSHEAGALFHTDAVQAFGKISLDMEALGIDLLSLSGHKIYGPKGIGALAVRKRVQLSSFVTGGEQERGRRAGTENVAAIVGLRKAAELSLKEREEENRHLTLLEEKLRELLSKENKSIHFNNAMGERKLPGYLSVSFPKVQAEGLLVLLDMEGVAISVGSACASGSIEVSHVLKAIHIEKELEKSTVRLTLGRENTMEEILKAAKKITKAVQKLTSFHEHMI